MNQEALYRSFDKKRNYCGDKSCDATCEYRQHCMDVSSVLFIMEGNLIKVASQEVSQEKYI